MKNFLVVLTLMFSSVGAIADFDCASSKPFPFLIEGYLSAKPDAVLRGAALNKDDSTPRKLFEISNPDPAYDSTYSKVFDIGIYRFVRNSYAKNGWDIFRKDTPTSKWVKQSDLPNPLKVFVDQPVVVRIIGRNEISIERMSGDDRQAKALTIRTEKTEIKLQSGQRKFSYSLKSCLDKKIDGDKKEVKAEPVKK